MDGHSSNFHEANGGSYFMTAHLIITAISREYIFRLTACISFPEPYRSSSGYNEHIHNKILLGRVACCCISEGLLNGLIANKSKIRSKSRILASASSSIAISHCRLTNCCPLIELQFKPVFVIVTL